MALTGKDRDALLAAIANPPMPNKRLVAALSLSGIASCSDDRIEYRFRASRSNSRRGWNGVASPPHPSGSGRVRVLDTDHKPLTQRAQRRNQRDELRRVHRIEDAPRLLLVLPEAARQFALADAGLAHGLD